MRGLTRRALLFSALTVFTLGGYNNCGSDFAPDQASLFSVSDPCLDELLRVYSQSYHPFLTSTCASCHTLNGSAGLSRAFAETDVAFDLNVVRALTKDSPDKISVRATDSHGSPYTGPQNAVAAAEAMTKFNAGNLAYSSCKGTAVPAPPAPPVAGIRTISKPIGAFATTRTLTWTFATEIDPTTPTPVGLSLTGIRLTVTLAKPALPATGYLISNPTLATGATPIAITSLRPIINGALAPQYSTFGFLNSNVAANSTGTVLMPATMVVQMPAVAADTLGFQIEGFTASTNPPPPAVRLSDLMGPTGVFRVSCYGCHNTATPNNFNLDSYASYINVRVIPNNAAGSRVIIRMTNAASPMPPSGILSSTLTDQVRSWINNGALNN